MAQMICKALSAGSLPPFSCTNDWCSGDSSELRNRCQASAHSIAIAISRIPILFSVQVRKLVAKKKKKEIRFCGQGYKHHSGKMDCISSSAIKSLYDT